MADLGRADDDPAGLAATGWRRDFDDIEAKGPRLRRTQRTKVGGTGATQGFFLARIDRIVSRHQRMGRARLHLDKDQDFAIAANQIELVAPVARAVPVARDDGKASLALKKFRRGPFTGRASVSRVTPAVEKRF